MDLQELRRQHFIAAERYFEAVVELQRMRAAGVSRQDYQIFWRDTVEAAASAVRSARVALQQAWLHADDAQGLGFDSLNRSAMTLDVTAEF
jgi:multidrug resistance efflux pump